MKGNKLTVWSPKETSINRRLLENEGSLIRGPIRSLLETKQAFTRLTEIIKDHHFVPETSRSSGNLVLMLMYS